jgi:protein O-mannosyl-transferase
MRNRRKPLTSSDNNAVPSAGPKWATPTIMVLLVLLTLAAYWQVGRNDFVFFDDSAFIIDNPPVRAGLTWDGFKWACRELYTDYWHPLTWLTMMLDIQLFGMRAGWHHMVNLAIHILSTLLLFHFLRYVTGRQWLAAFVAALFALHPLHVESVAWAAERKDVLSTLFWFATILAYAWYAKKPSGGRYAWVALLFALGLLSKPMLVTLPLVLLLLDYWPLERFDIAGFRVTGTKGTSLAHLLLEKVPLLVMALGVTAATVTGQSKTAMVALSTFGWPARICNATVSYARYITQMFWPVGLTAFYPLPRHAVYWQAALAGAILLAITAAVFYFGRRHRYLLTGWLWYIVTLLPVIGIIQVGRQSHADRYTYIPLTGLFVILIWGGAELSQDKPRLKATFTAAVAAAIFVLTAITWQTVSYWQSSETLLNRAMAVCKDNYIWRANWATILSDFGRDAEARSILEEVVSKCTEDERADALNSLGTVLARTGRNEDALQRFRQAAELRPNDALSLYNMGAMLIIVNRPQEALEPFRRAVERDPSYSKARVGLGMAMAASGDIAGGIAELTKAIEIDPGFAPAYLALGRAYAAQSNWLAAAAEFKKSLAIQHDYPALVELGRAQESLGDLAGAEASYRMAVTLQPNNAVAHYNLGSVLAKLGQKDAADLELKKAQALGFKDSTGR